MNVDLIRHEILQSRAPGMKRRRRIGLLSALGLVDFAIISLYQTGTIHHLPDLPGKIFDSDKVNASKKAFGMGLPDGTVGATLYGVTMMLAAAGGSKSTGRPRLFSLALVGVVGAGVVGAIQNIVDMAKNQEKACPYCLTGAALNFAMLPLALKDAWEDWKPSRAGA